MLSNSFHKAVSSWDQNQRYHKKTKLQTKVSYDFRCKNPPENTRRGNDPRWPIDNSSGLQLSVKAQRTRGRHTFRQILVAHGAEDPQWRNHTGPQRDSWDGRSSCDGTSAQQLSEQSKRDWFPFWPRFGAQGRQSRLLRTQKGSQTGESWEEKHHQL